MQGQRTGDPGGIVVLVILVVFSLWAISRKMRSDEQKRIAERLRREAEARAMIERSSQTQLIYYEHRVTEVIEYVCETESAHCPLPALPLPPSPPRRAEEQQRLPVVRVIDPDGQRPADHPRRVGQLAGRDSNQLPWREVDRERHG